MNSTSLIQNLDGSLLQVGIVQSRFNESITDILLKECLKELENLKVHSVNILTVPVPGALEIPITLAKLAESGQFDVLIALGAVVRGETYHFEIVANESAAGIRQVSVETLIPIINGILTTENETQALARAKEKGREVARVAIEMARLSEALDDLAFGYDEEDDEQEKTLQ